MQFSHAYLEELGSSKLRVEEALVLSELERRGISHSFYTKKRIQRRQLPIASTDFIMGDMDSMHGAMRQIGIEPPTLDDYPEALHEFMHRRTWRSTVGELVTQLADEFFPCLFAKPAGRRKLFTGRVFEKPQDVGYLEGVSRAEPIVCSELVHWVSEYRVFIIGADIVAVDHYAGDAAVELDIDLVKTAVRRFSEQPSAIVACGIDFGVLATGATALVEANDGYALGAYSVAAEPYTDVLFSRWAQLLGTRSTS